MTPIIFYCSWLVYICAMRSLAFLMTACFLVFSVFSGMVPATAASKTKADCCQRMAGKASCHHPKGQDQKGGCERSGCNMLSSCGACGFLAVEPVVIQSVSTEVVREQMAFCNSGRLTTYATDNWKPPKAC